MNRYLGKIGALTCLAGVLGFALSMLCGSNNGSYLTSLFIALGYGLFTCALVQTATADKRVAGFAAVMFACVYIMLALLVYFAQLTAVRLDALDAQARAVLDYQTFGLYFSYDLLGYAMMALSTFFAGLALTPQTVGDKWLKGLLLAHGAFFPICLVMPMLGLFRSGAPGMEWIGTALLLFWCAYFTPVCLLAANACRRIPDGRAEPGAGA